MPQIHIILVASTHDASIFFENEELLSLSLQRRPDNLGKLNLIFKLRLLGYPVRGILTEISVRVLHCLGLRVYFCESAIGITSF